MKSLTAKQQESLDRVKAELADRWNMHGIYFDIDYRDESRPGRGHDIAWWACDGERLAQGCIDVYGNGDGYGVGDIDWIHGGEECECEFCEPESGAP